MKEEKEEEEKNIEKKVDLSLIFCHIKFKKLLLRN